MFCKNAKWIECEKYSAPIIIKKITIGEFEKANIKISGLGYYELFINGNRVGEEFFKPAVSDYRRRDFSNWLYPLDDETSHTVYYNVYDITKYLKSGENVIAVMLGNGFYRQKLRDIEGKVYFGETLLACFEISAENCGKTEFFVTDGSEIYIESFITENNLFYGETHDYSNFDLKTLETGNVKGEYVKIAPDFDAKFIEQTCPNDKIIKTLAPFKVSEKNGKTIYGVEENIAGFVTFTSLGENVIIRHAENLDENGELDYFSAGSKDQISKVEYIATKKGQKLHPYFCWSGFKYFEIEGNVSNLQVAIVHSDINVTSYFKCGNKNLQWLYDAYIRTQLNNMHGGVPSDCPHRERLGYTGDGQLCAESAMLLLDSKLFYEKWMQDIADCQDIKSGHVQHTAPLCGGGGGPGGWGGAMAIVPYSHYKLYKDKNFIEKYFENIKRFIESMKGFCDNGLIVKEREKGWCLGDWCTPEPIVLPEPFVNTYYYIICMQIAEYLAKEIGKTVDYSSEIENSKAALVKNYYDEKTSSFCGGIQGADAFAVAIGLGDKKTEENIYAKYDKLKCFDTGIFGTEVLTDLLVKRGKTELLYKLLSSEKFASFGFMRKNGATTIWEDWDGKSSHDHPMFGACVKQIFYGIMGISILEGGKHVTVKPVNIPDLKFVDCKLKIGGGELYISYTYSKTGVNAKITADNLPVTLKTEKGDIDVDGEMEYFINKG